MPRLKCRKRNKITMDIKKKKLLKARLIRISMVIDDYVYKNKAISTSDAKMYAEEVSTYKPQCADDVRSLQVIEKITRCMNAVITEQQEENGDTIDFQNTSPNYCPSPVYSLPEEDRTMLSQTSCNLNPTVESEENNMKNIETVDLCSDDDVTIQRNVQVDVEIHRAMSNLNIKENDLNKDLNMVDCSQSILENFNVNREDEIRKSTSPNKPPTKKVSKTNSFKVRNEYSSTQNMNCSQSILTEFSPNVAELVKNTTTTERLQANKFKTPKINHFAPKNNVTEVKTVQFDDNVRTTDISKDNAPKIKKPKRKRKEASKMLSQDKAVKRKKKTDQNVLLQVPAKPTKISMKERTSDNNKSIDGDTNDILTLPLHKIDTSNKTIHTNDIRRLNKVNNAIYSKSMAKIYNVNIENDLSWVENIRYVREICTDEFDPKYASLEENFWDTFALPYDWNDKDFDFIT